MRNTLIPFVLLCFTACGSGDNAQSTKQAGTSTEEVVVANQKPEPLKNPCELLLRTELEAIEGFQKSTNGSLHKGSGDTYKQCDFSLNYDDKNAHLTIIFRRLNDRQIEVKKLERDYDFYLKQDGYTAVPNTSGDQAYYNHKATDIPSGKDHSYCLQLRYGNHTEYQIALNYGNDAQDSETVLKRLLTIAKKLEE